MSTTFLAEPEPSAVDAVRAPLGILFKNPLPVLAIVGILLAGTLVNLALSLLIPVIGSILGLIISFLVMVGTLPTLSTLVRAHRAGEKWTLKRALNASAGGIASMFFYSIAVYFILAIVSVMFVLLSVLAIGIFGDASIWIILIMTVTGYPIITWWVIMVLAASAAGADKPLRVGPRTPLGRSVGGIILGFLVFYFVPLTVGGFVLAGIFQGVALTSGQDVSAALVTTAAVIQVSIALFLAFACSALFFAGITTLIDPELASPIRPRARKSRANAATMDFLFSNPSAQVERDLSLSEAPTDSWLSTDAAAGATVGIEELDAGRGQEGQALEYKKAEDWGKQSWEGWGTDGATTGALGGATGLGWGRKDRKAPSNSAEHTGKERRSPLRRGRKNDAES